MFYFSDTNTTSEKYFLFKTNNLKFKKLYLVIPTRIQGLAHNTSLDHFSIIWNDILKCYG